MSLSIEQVVQWHPRLFHMAQEGSFESVMEHGLLSTLALLDRFEVEDPERTELLREVRPKSVTIEHPDHGTAVIRDNIPLRADNLAPVLDDCLSVNDWCEILNRRVYFWLTPERLSRLLRANAYKKTAHDVFTIDTAALLARHADRVRLCRINSGSCIYPAPSAARRGLHTFAAIQDYPYTEYKRRFGGHPLAELTVDYSVPDLRDFVIQVDRRQQDDVLETLYST